MEKTVHFTDQRRQTSMRKVYEVIDPDTIPAEHPVRIFSDYWNTLKTDNDLVLRKSFSPAAVPKILPFLMIMDVLSGGEDYHVRLMGEVLNSFFGFSLAGKDVSTCLDPETLSYYRGQFNPVIEKGLPEFSYHEYELNEQISSSAYRAIFPFSTSGEQYDQLFMILASSDRLL